MECAIWCCGHWCCQKSASAPAPAAAPSAVTSVEPPRAEPGAGAKSGGGLKRDVDLLRSALGVDAALSLTDALHAVCVALCEPHEGALLPLVRRLTESALPALKKRIERLQTELGLSEGHASLVEAVRAAGSRLGEAPQEGAPLCKQVERLLRVVGVHDA